MESTIRISSSMVKPVCSSSKLCVESNRSGKICYGFRFGGSGCITKVSAMSPNGSFSHYRGESSSVGDTQRQRSSLESLFSYDKLIPEERIEKPVGIALDEKKIGDNPPCINCQAKGAVLCATCSGSGLYVDSILESQGIIVKVRCLGCGGSGNIMCSECGGRGHLGPK